MDTFDELLSKSDTDDQSWADGIDAERASNLMSAFTEHDLALLQVDRSDVGLLTVIGRDKSHVEHCSNQRLAQQTT